MAEVLGDGPPAEKPEQSEEDKPSLGRKLVFWDGVGYGIWLCVVIAGAAIVGVEKGGNVAAIIGLLCFGTAVLGLKAGASLTHETPDPSDVEKARLEAADVIVGIQSDLLKRAAVESDESARKTYLAASDITHGAFESWRPERWGIEATKAGFPPVD